MGLLEGTKKKALRIEEEKGEKEEKVQDITKELVRQLKKLKDRKALGEDGIKNEAWKYMSEEVGTIF